MLKVFSGYPYYEILSEYGGYLYSISQSIEAKRILKSLEHNRYIRNKSHIYFILGYVYNDTQQWDSAYYYNRKVLATGSIDKKYNSYINLAKLEEKKYNKNEALQYLKKAILLNDSIQKIVQTEAIAKINSLYNYQHLERENSLLKLSKEKQKSSIYIILLCLIIIISTGISYILYYKKEKLQVILQERKAKQIAEENYAKSQEAIQENQRKIAELDSSLDKANLEKNRLLQELFLIQKKKIELRNQDIILSMEEQELYMMTFKQSDYYEQLQNAAKGHGDSGCKGS